MYNFNVEKETKRIIRWLRNKLQIDDNTFAKVVLGISGGKDSTIVLKLLVEAIGKENVFGVIMPNGDMEDFALAEEVCHLMDINYTIVNIQNAYHSICDQPCIINYKNGEASISPLYITAESKINIAPRLRMTINYAIAQTLGGRVVGTSNLSERFIGYGTKAGDLQSDLNPIGNYTCTEVIQIGHYLGLPAHLIDKTPSDGLCGKTDEDRFGFTYKVLDAYIRTEICDDETVKEKIMIMHKNTQHKRELIPLCDNDLFCAA